MIIALIKKICNIFLKIAQCNKDVAQCNKMKSDIFYASKKTAALEINQILNVNASYRRLLQKKHVVLIEGREFLHFFKIGRQAVIFLYSVACSSGLGA